MSKTVALMQPCYLPWPGHFHFWMHADEMIWLDDFQYSRGSYHSRNRVLADNQQGWQWITVPVSHHLGDSLLQAKPAAAEDWRRKHVDIIRQRYARAPYLTELTPILDCITGSTFTSLADLNLQLLAIIGRLLGIPSVIKRSSTLNLTATGRSERVLEILKVTAATRYRVARGSVGYMLEDGLWAKAPIELTVQNFSAPFYPQGKRSAFVSHLSIVDAIAHLGSAAVRQTLVEAANAWIPFAEAARNAAS